MPVVIIILYIFYAANLFSQPNVPQTLLRNKEVVVKSQFDAAYGFFLRKYAKSYDESYRYVSYADIVNELNERMKTKVFCNLEYAKVLGVRMPVSMILYELHFLTEKSAQIIENYLLEQDGILNTSIAPDYFIFTKNYGNLSKIDYHCRMGSSVGAKYL